MPAGSSAPDKVDAFGAAYCGRFLGTWMPADERGRAADNAALSAPPHACRLAFAFAFINTQVQRTQEHLFSAASIQKHTEVIHLPHRISCAAYHMTAFKPAAASNCPYAFAYAFVRMQAHSKRLNSGECAAA
jgi:hypothetical protein